jgi:hypothetical protein
MSSPVNLHQPSILFSTTLLSLEIALSALA